MTAYVTTEQASAYLAQCLNAAAWTTATPERQAAALATAQRLLDALPFVGRVTSTSQPDAWPRTGVVDHEGRVIPSAAIPPQIAAATSEWALHLLTQADPNAQPTPVRKKRVGDLQLEYAPTTADPLPPMVRTLLGPLLKTSANTAQVIPA